MTPRAPTAPQTIGGTLALVRAMCTAERFPRSGCRLCEEACTRGALQRSADAWELGSSCDACGACVAACPTGALDLVSSSTSELDRAVDEQLVAQSGGVVFACERCAANDAIPVPCAARLEEAILVAAALRGARRVAVRLGPCSSCDRRDRLRRTLGITLRSARAVLHACGVDPALIHLETSRHDTPEARPGAPPNPGRRALFARLFRTPPSNGPPRQGPPGETLSRRHRLLAAVNAHRTALRPTQAEDLVLGRIAVDGSCLGCTTCAHVCATRAITREEAPAGDVTICFDPGLCIACGACAEACFPRSITLQAEPSLSALAAPREFLARVPRRECPTCGEAFHSRDEDACPRCRLSDALSNRCRQHVPA